METFQRLVTQFINSFFLSFTISCVISLVIMGGFSQEWLGVWLRNAAMAWPMSFILVQFTLPFARLLTGKMFSTNNAPVDCETNTSILPVITQQLRVVTGRIDLP